MSQKFTLILSLAKNDFKSKYSGSALGVFWAFLQPVVTIFIYWFVFQVAFHSGPVGDVPYVLWLVAGIVPWFFFSDAWGGITGCLIDYSFLVKKVAFDISALPWVRLLSAFFVHLFFVALIFIVALFCGRPPSFLWFQVLYYMLCAAALALGVGRLTAVLMAFFKDTGNIVGIFVQFGFWLTPIFWDISAVPAQIGWIFRLNPVYYIVDGFRGTFVYGQPFYARPLLGLYFWVVAIALLGLSRLFFKKMKPHFADTI